MQQQPIEGDPVKRAEKTFGERMRNFRDRAEISQRELAKRLKEVGVDIDPSAITRIERGERSVKLGEAQAIAQILGQTVGELLGETPKVTPLQTLRDRANAEMHQARLSLAEMLTDMALIQHRLRVDPRALSQFADESVPQSPDDYLPWVRSRMQGLTRGWNDALAATHEDAEWLRKIAQSMLGHLVLVDPLYFEELAAHDQPEGSNDG